MVIGRVGPLQLALCGNAHFTRENLAFNSLKTLTNSAVINRLQTSKMVMITLSRYIHLRLETSVRLIKLAGAQLFMNKFLVSSGWLLGEARARTNSRKLELFFLLQCYKTPELQCLYYVPDITDSMNETVQFAKQSAFVSDQNHIKLMFPGVKKQFYIAPV